MIIITHQFITGDVQHCGMPNAINRMKITTTKFSTAQQQNNQKKNSFEWTMKIVTYQKCSVDM
jgi:hypothetical protein